MEILLKRQWVGLVLVISARDGEEEEEDEEKTVKWWIISRVDGVGFHKWFNIRVLMRWPTPTTTTAGCAFPCFYYDWLLARMFSRPSPTMLLIVISFHRHQENQLEGLLFYGGTSYIKDIFTVDLMIIRTHNQSVRRTDCISSNSFVSFGRHPGSA